MIYTYDKHNKLIKTKLNDVEYEYTYDKNYNVVREKNPLGNEVEWTYDNEGNTTQVKDEEGNITTNEYDSIGRLIKQTDGNGNDTELKYDRNNNVVELKTAENITNKFEYDKEGKLTKEIDGENHFVKYEYDGLGNILKTTTESNEITTYTYDKHNIMTSMTDALGSTERYETNLNKQITKKIQKDGTVYHYNYDRAKRLINTIDPMNYRINLIYSIGDDIVKTTDTLGRQVNYEYDILHNQTKKIDANNNIELYIYDYRGNVTKTIDRRESIDKYTYNLTDNLIEWTDANNNKTTYSYDKVGNILELRQPNGALTKYEYDNNYNRIKLTNPRGKITTYTYDRDNRLISETDPLGNTKRYNYNGNNNLKEYTTALGNTRKYIYDTDNNLIKEIDPRNKVKEYLYDKNNRLTKTTSELNNTANFTYDTVDNVVGIKDPKGTNTVFDYNDVGKIVQERSVDNTIRTYNYDRAGRLISKVNKDHSKIAYDYDANDNLVKKYYLDLNNQQTDDSIVYSYNAENNRLGMNDKSGLSRTLYDNKGNLIVSTSNNDEDIVRYEYDSNDRITKITYPTNAIVTYTYDENDNIKTVTDKDGLKTTYTYDENDNEVIRTTGLIETNKRYDADNRLIRIKNEHRFTGELVDEYSYRYDSNNNIIEEIKREPYRKKVSLLDIDTIEENDYTIRVTKQNFTYDDENKLTNARVERLGMKALSEPNVTTYHYEYDLNGNRTLVEIKDDGLTLESTVYTFDRLNKMVGSREVTASGLYLYEYTYDDNGNLISEDRHRQFETQRTNIRRYEYTKDNKLESVYSGNTLLVSYTYDGDGTITSSLERDLDLNQNLNIHDTNYINSLTNNQRQLINKVPSNDSFLYELTEYITDKNRPYSEILMERDGTGQLSTIYTYGNQRINSESYNNLSGLYTYDGRGSVSAVIGSYGDFRASYWYDGLGNVKSQIHGYGAFGSGKKYYGYNAEQYNPVTGSQNLRARQVNIRRQRFLTEDTYIGTKTNILSINRYSYAESNPLKYKDPSGNDALSNIRSVAEGIKNIRENHGNIVRKGVNLAQAGGDVLIGNPLYRYIVKPIMQNRWDAAFKSIGMILGGQLVAGVITENSDFLNEKIFERFEPYSNYLQECTDMFADDTYKGIDYWTKLAGGGAGFRTMEDDSGNDIIVTNYWTFQGVGGYTPFYDSVFHRYTKSDNDQIDIGNGYKIWIWKGDYLNLGAGGEIGIYNEYITNDYGVVGTTMSEQLGIKMTMKIIDKTTGNDVVNRSTPSEQWWITGWNPAVQGLSDEDLDMTGELDFSNSKDSNMYYSLKESAMLEKLDPRTKVKSIWTFDDATKTATFRWRK